MILFRRILTLLCALYSQHVITYAQDVTCGRSGRCYKYYDTFRTYADAENVCFWDGGSIVTVKSPEEQDELVDILTQVGATQTWLNAVREEPMNDYGFQWAWISDGSIVSYQGCYKDDPSSPDLSVRTGLPADQVDHDACQLQCLNMGMKFYGLQDGTECYCSNTFGRYEHVNTFEDGNCVLECEGSRGSTPRQYCGGTGLNAVYALDGAYTAWAYGKPNNYHVPDDIGPLSQACGAMDLFHGGKFDDEECFNSYGYVCDLPNAGGCTNSGEVTVEGRCVYIGAWEKTWFDARAACADLGGDLVKVDSDAFRLGLKDVLAGQNSYNKWWIGLSKQRWYWGADPSTREEVVYTAWAAGQPQDPASPCAMVNTALEPDHGWLPTRCSNFMNFLCLVSEPTTTPTTTTTTTTTTQPTTTTTTTTTKPPTTTTTTTTSPSTTTTTTTVPTTTTKTTTTTKPSTTTTSSSVRVSSTKTSSSAASTTTTTTSSPTTTRTTTSSTTTTTTPEVTTTDAQPVLPNSGTANNVTLNQGSGSPSAGASTGGESSGLSTAMIIMIVIIVLLVLIMIILVVILLSFKRANNKKNKVAPNSVYIEPEDHIFYSNETLGGGSKANLVDPDY